MQFPHGNQSDVYKSSADKKKGNGAGHNPDPTDEGNHGNTENTSHWIVAGEYDDNERYGNNRGTRYQH